MSRAVLPAVPSFSVGGCSAFTLGFRGAADLVDFRDFARFVAGGFACDFAVFPERDESRLSLGAAGALPLFLSPTVDGVSAGKTRAADDSAPSCDSSLIKASRISFSA